MKEMMFESDNEKRAKEIKLNTLNSQNSVNSYNAQEIEFNKKMNEKK